MAEKKQNVSAAINGKLEHLYIENIIQSLTFLVCASLNLI